MESIRLLDARHPCTVNRATYTMNSRSHLDCLTNLRLSLQMLEKTGDLSSPSIADLRRILLNRIAELKVVPKLAVLDITCPVCNQPPGFPCVARPLRSRFNGEKVLMRQPHRQRFSGWNAAHAIGLQDGSLATKVTTTTDESPGLQGKSPES